MNIPNRIPMMLIALCSVWEARADPRVTSWYTGDSGRYARIYESKAAEAARAASVTWSRGSGVQSSPTYAGVSEVMHSASWVYIRSTGLAGHLMGPWYLDAAKTQNFPNFPSNNAVLYRIPRVPEIPAVKTLTGLGVTGRMVNGVSIFDSRDSFSYVNASGQDATPVNGLRGDGVWNRDGYHNEGVTFDPALAHQAGSNYHYHAHPIALRHQLGDHVDYDAVTNRYRERSGLPAKHSPVVGWAADGLPVYGPYGYAEPMEAGSGLRRMVSGFVLRDGRQGSDNLVTVGRTALPAWAQRVQGRAVLTAGQYGPAVSAAYQLGHYLEDFAYLGDLGKVQGRDFDLNEQNVRWCVTPEFPAGTWAYFTTINADGTPAYPYTTGRQYFGNPSGGAVTAVSETVVTHWKGGPARQEAITGLQREGGDVRLGWSAVEGGSYRVEATDGTTGWTVLGSAGTVTGGNEGSYTEVGGALSARRFYRVARTGLAAYDSSGFGGSDGGGGGGGGGTSVAVPGGTVQRGGSYALTITIPAGATPPVPPANVPPSAVTIGGSAAGVSAVVHVSQYVVSCTWAVPAGSATGPRNVVVSFVNPQGATISYTLSGGITVN